MTKNHVQKKSKATSTKQPKDKPIWEQLDLFELARINDETEVGFAVRNGL